MFLVAFANGSYVIHVECVLLSSSLIKIYFEMLRKQVQVDLQVKIMITCGVLELPYCVCEDCVFY